MVSIESDHQKSEYASFGFVRQYSSEFPMDIAGVISQFVSMDVVYAFNEGDLFRMSVDEILEKCE